MSLLLATLLAPALQDFDIPFRKFVLENGLQVVVHEDHSDPIVSVYVSYHVGSGREERGRSGFAHLFEHMLFQGSQHVGDDQHFKMVSEAGGTLNGTTNTDRTLYFETLPKNQLELALWLEADRMGFLLPAVTQEKLDNQRDVVKNERRQNYENRPYGQAAGALAAALYPPDHPYSWLTIGSHEDLTAASLDDVHGFFRRWYGPNNATLAIGGDVSTADAMALVEKYFGALPRGPRVEAPQPRPAPLSESVRVVVEDQVKLPQVTIAWSGVRAHSEDDAALEALAMLLAESKSSVLERALRIDEVLARDVRANNDSREIAGEFEVVATAAPGVDLDRLEGRIRELVAKLDKDGVSAEALANAKTRFEARTLRRYSTVGSRTSALADTNTFLGDPSRVLEPLQRMREVTPEEVRAALHRYLIGKPTVVVSVVPAGKRELAATGRTPDQIARESSFDRNAKPGAGPRPALHTPRVWRETFANGVRAIGTRGAEVPVTEILIAIPGGRRSESLDKLGVSSLTAQLMNEGTRKLSTTQLADALDALGATLQISSDDDELSLRLSALDKNLKASVALLGDALLEPRFDSADFDRMRKRRLVAIDTRGDSIRTVAGNAFRRLLYGDADVLGFPDDGTKATVSKLTLDDVKAFHAQALAPGRSRVAVVSALEPLAVRELLSPLMSRWKAPAGAPAADLAAASAARGAGIGRPGVIYLVDKPGASQSELRVGHVGIAKNDPDNDAVSVVNYVLGGAFSSRINMNLREAKGYTYGARTAFDGGLVAGPFFMSAGVKAGDTAPALTETLKELTAIGDGVKPEELAFAKSAMEQAMTGSFESPQARIRLVDDIAKFGYSDDVLEKRAGVIEGLTEVESKRLATKHIRTGDMVILVVGDKKQIGASLAESGKTVVELDIDGRTLEAEGRAPAGG